MNLPSSIANSPALKGTRKQRYVTWLMNIDELMNTDELMNIHHILLQFLLIVE